MLEKQSSVAEVVWGSGAGWGEEQRGRALCRARFTRQSCVPGPYLGFIGEGCIIADTRHTLWPTRTHLI